MKKTHVLRELVMEVVVALSNRDKSSDPMVARSVLVVERSLSEPVSERVDAESRVVNEEESSSSCENPLATLRGYQSRRYSSLAVQMSPLFCEQEQTC